MQTIFVCGLLFALLVIPSHSYSCNSSESCTAVHLNNPWLLKALDLRCTIDSNPRLRSRRTIAFTHVPKCGGSTVHAFLYGHVRDRYLNGPPHEPYPSTLKRKLDTLFYITLFRRPLSRVVSMYQYIRDKLVGVQRALPRNVKSDFLWRMGQRSRDIVHWLNMTGVEFELSRVIPELFIEPYHKGISIEKYYIARANYSFPFPYEPYIPIEYHNFLNYTHDIPEPYHCMHHMKVALLLLQRYEVVGVLEQFTDFWNITFRRAALPHMLYEKATSIHSNKSKYTVSPQHRAIAAEMLEIPLYCSTLVWEIATMISDKDKTCSV